MKVKFQGRGCVLASRCGCLLAMLCLASSGAFAQTAAGNLPWEGPLATLVTSITGPVAFAIAVVGILACGAGLVFGGEMTELLRRLLQVGISVAIIVFAVQVLNNWIGFAAEVAVAHPLSHYISISC